MASARQLVAVMLTDIVGFATLTQQNEAAALQLVKEQENLVRPLLKRYRGREVKTIGDAFLVEFESALGATQCATELQRTVFEWNRRTTSRKIELRIGIHVGDVVRREEDIYGDTVNIVSRITPTAETGGICVSSPVYEQVRNKIDFSFHPIEAGPLKHIDLPVTIYRVELPWLTRGVGKISSWTGRDSELDALRQKIDSTQRGEGGVLVISGEVGIGKSRLAEEGIKYAQRNGFRVLRGHALPGELGLPYSHWSDAVREFLRTAPPQLVYKTCGTHTSEIARLVPEITEIVGSLPPAPPLEPEQARFRFFQGITLFFENLSKEAPLLLFFDELQWADAASLRLLQQAAPKLSGSRVLVMAAYAESEVGSGGPFQEVLHALHRDHLLTRVRLSRLDKATTEAMIVGLLGGERPSLSLVGSVYDMTGGNPFYVEEVVRSLVEDGTVFRKTTGGWDRKPTGEAELPTSVREIVQRRVNSLSADDRALLSVAAVLGADFRPGVLALVAGVQENDLLEPIERLLRAQVIKERSVTQTNVTYFFTDAQLRRLLYEDLSYLRRRGYHQKAAIAIEALPRNPSDDSSASELEYHFLRGNDSAKALEYAVKAGEHAARLYSHEDAIRHNRTALELLEAAPDERRQSQLLKVIGAAELGLSHVDAGIRALRQAAEGFERSGNKMEAAALFVQVASLESWYHNDLPTSLALSGRARTILEREPEGKELASLYLQTAWRLFGEGRFSEFSELHAKARALAERLGDHDLEIQLELDDAYIVPAGKKAELFEHLRRGIEIALQHDLRAWLPPLYITLGRQTMEISGDGKEALRLMHLAVESARAIGDVGWEMAAEKHMVAFVDLKLGELREASRLTDQLWDFMQENFPHPLPGHLCALSEVATLLGNYDRADELLQLFDSHPPETEGPYCRGRTRNIRGRLSLAKSDPARAEAAFSATLRLFDEGRRTATMAPLAAEALAGLVETRLRSGDVVTAGAALDQLTGLAREIDVAPIHGYSYRAVGMMAMNSGDSAGAETALLRSAEAWRKIGWRYDLAVSLSQLGALYRHQGNVGQAAKTLSQAIEMFTEMGAGPDATRALELANQLKV
jgi:class 3 adenylate cyclase